MKTMAELKREANSGKMALELVERYGSTEIIDRLKGVRPVIKANSVGLILRNMDGQESHMDIKKASLMEYDGETLKVYTPGTRPLNSAEINALEKAEKARKDYEACYNGADGYYVYKRALMESPFPYLIGDSCKGCRYDRCRNQIFDDTIKGDMILVYKVHRVA